MPPCALALTLHDTEGRLADLIRCELPTLSGMFQGVAVAVTDASSTGCLEALTGVRAFRAQDLAESRPGSGTGRHRRLAVAAALDLGAETVLYCDCDRALHWAMRFPDELRRVGALVAENDFTVLGRTARAFATHPRIQRDTEVIINEVFARVSGHRWDVGAGARGISRRAAEAILAGCPDDELSNDVSWPLCLERMGGFTIGYIETEGLEFETADRYADEVAAAGGLDAWMGRLDADPRQWLRRLEVARIEIEGMAPYVRLDGGSPDGRLT